MQFKIIGSPNGRGKETLGCQELVFANFTENHLVKKRTRSCLPNAFLFAFVNFLKESTTNSTLTSRTFFTNLRVSTRKRQNNLVF